MTFAGRDWEDDELELFRAGKGEAPPAGSAAGVFAALGLDGPIGPDGGDAGPVSSVEPAGTTPVPEAVQPTAPSASGIFARPLTWIGAGTVALALISAGLWLGSSDGQTSTSAATPNVAVESEPVSEATGVQAAAPVEATKEDEAIALSDLEEIEEPASPTQAGPNQKLDSAERPSLAEELALIKRARSSLNAGDLAGCQAALAEHGKKFNPPRLASEALVVRVELLVKQGKTAEARRLAAPLMRENSPYRARMETLLSH